MKAKKTSKTSVVFQNGDIQLKVVKTDEGFSLAAKDVKTKDFIQVGHVRNSQTGDGLMLFDQYQDIKRF